MFFVRTATERDLPFVRDILVETWHATYDAIYGVEKVNEITSSWHTLDRLLEQQQSPNSEFLVADNGDVVGGMAFASQTDKVINLHQLYVLPKYHGGKTGVHLLIEIENSFLDVEVIRLEVEAQNEKAVGFYKAYGFRQVGETANCGKEDSGIPALIMEKSIIFAEE
ncbi:MAG: GNAT family N-acetyltransferase [Pseudomonadota bacterium]